MIRRPPRTTPSTVLRAALSACVSGFMVANAFDTASLVLALGSIGMTLAYGISATSRIMKGKMQ